LAPTRPNGMATSEIATLPVGSPFCSALNMAAGE
jgi:hypothetical protein